jgi:exopolysaccharide biosynthesis polyprenyl glycosylphosphotransferase
MSLIAESLPGSITSPLPLRSHDRAPRAVDVHAGRARGRRWTGGRPHVVAQGLFRHALIRERRRADRFEQPFMLLLVSPPPGAAGDSGTWEPVIEALAVAKRETDLLGWFENGSVLGLILPEIDSKDSAFPRKLHQRVTGELAARLDVESAASFELRLHLHSGAGMASDRNPGAVRLALKRGLDILGSLGLLAVLSPLFLAIAAVIRLTSPGPIFFRQERIGEGAKPFRMLKFRTMQVHADPAIHQQYVRQFIRTNAAAAAVGPEVVFKITNDPRVTRVGRFLRRTSLDELPQFWNVLKGEMSLVGPRPPLPYEVEEYKTWHYRRVFEAKPGITGLWQVTGRSRTTFDEMVRLDLRYARTHSVWTDIKILLATPRAVISGKGAC